MGITGDKTSVPANELDVFFICVKMVLVDSENLKRGTFSGGTL